MIARRRTSRSEAGSPEPVVVVAEGRGADRSALAAVRALANAGYAPVVAYSHPPSLAAVSRFCVQAVESVGPDTAGFASVISGVAAQVGAKSVFASGDASLTALTPHLASLVDKRSLLEAATEAGLEMPASRLFSGPADLVSESEMLPYPIVVKPALKTAERPVRIARRPDELQVEDYVGGLVVQPYLEGPMFAIAGVMWRGEVVVALQQRYVRTWPIDCGTASLAVVEEIDDVLLERLSRMMHDHDGIFQAQFVAGRLIDLNPRVYGSMPLALAAGLNLPATVCRLERGEDPDRPSARLGTTYRWLEGDLRHLVQGWRKGSIALSRVAPEVVRGADAFSVVARDDMAPARTRLGRVLGRTRALPAQTTGAEESATTPDPGTTRRMQRAQRIVEEAMGGIGGVLSYSPLGPGWSSDIDVYFEDGIDSAMTRAAEMGWIPLDGLLTHLAYPGRGRWAVVDGGEVLCRVDLQKGTPPDPVERISRRAHREGEVSLRTTLELKQLIEAGHSLRGAHPEVLAAAARIEAGQGGRALAAWLEAEPAPGPVLLGAGRRSVAGSIRARLRPSLAVGLTGVDGSGKSSTAKALAEALGNCGINHSIVWSRPGMGLRLLDRLATAFKRFTRRQAGLRELASGAEVQSIRSRRGIVGWLWSMAVTLAYLKDVWTQRLEAEGGVVIFDRHRIDADVTLEVFYGKSRTGVQRWLGRRLSPDTDVTLFLDVPAEVAVRRKQDDLVNELLVRRQTEVYETLISGSPGVVRIDATRGPDAILVDALRALDQMAASKPPGRWTIWVGSRRTR